MNDLIKNELDVLSRKQGYWENKLSDDNIISRGYYVNGLREGFWECFYKEKLQWKGNYRSANKIGYWEEYHRKTNILKEKNFHL